MSARAVVCIVWILAATPGAAAAADLVTARTALQAATESAGKWQPDAVLTGVSALETTQDGKAGKWSYLFFSSKANKGYSVTFAGAKRVEQLEVRPHVRDAVVARFIDSDRAIAVALQNGLDTKGKPITMSLLMMGQATKSPASAWTIGGGYDPGAVAVIVDARTGKMLFKQAVPK